MLTSPDSIPVVVGGLGAAADADAGVRAEEVDRSVRCLGSLDEPDHLGLDRDVRRHGDRGSSGSGDLSRHRRGTVRVEVGDDDARGAVRAEPPSKRAPDATRAAGDDDDLVSISTISP